MNTSSGNKRLTADKTGYDAADEGEEQSGRWLISYADLITTLMVLFLALYVLQLAKTRELEVKVLERHAVTEATSAAPDASKKRLLSLLEPLQDNRQITISNAAHGVEIAINAKVLFNSGDARLLPESFGVLNQIAGVLRDKSKNNIQVLQWC